MTDERTAVNDQSPRRTTRMTRRQSLGAAGAAGLAFALTRGPAASLTSPARAAAQGASCILVPAKTEGPYFVDELLERSDIRADADGSNVQDGVPLRLTLTILDSDNGCAVGEGVVVDLWHANASGDYSDISARTQSNTLGHEWLRGYQITDSSGQVTFTTVYPGWYEGRTVHIHFKVRAFDGTDTTYEFTSQLFFDQSINDTVESSEEYEGIKSVDNDEDSIYGGDDELLVPLQGSVSAGYEGAITLGLSGLPSSSDDPGDPDDGDEEVEASLLSARVKRDRDGRRTLVARFEAGEQVDVALRLIRDGEVLGRGRGSVASGGGAVSMRVKRKSVAGAATLRVALSDAAGNVKAAKRTLRVPRGS